MKKRALLMVISGFHDWLVRNSSWWRAGLLLVGFLACVAGFELRKAVLSLGAESDPGPGLDSLWGYTPQEVRSYFRKIGDRGKSLYASTELTLDVVFPLVYGGLFCMLMALTLSARIARFFVWAPVIAVAADLGENILLALLAWDVSDPAERLVSSASFLTMLKWTAVRISAAVAFVGVVWCLLMYCRTWIKEVLFRNQRQERQEQP